jgi:hypothetical protein
MTDDLVTAAEAAEISGKSPRTILRLIDRQVLVPAMKLPGETGAYLFRRTDVLALRGDAA